MAGFDPAASAFPTPRSSGLSYILMVRVAGLEPATSGVQARRSTRLSYTLTKWSA